MRGIGVGVALVVGFAALTLSGCAVNSTSSSGTPSNGQTAGPALSPAAVLEWNQTAIDASGLDHTPAGKDEDRVWGENLGPGRASRAMAIVQIAVFEAVNAIEGGYESYLHLDRVSSSANVEAAVATAAHDTLVALYPAQKTDLDHKLDVVLKRIGASDARSAGEDAGKKAASAILRLRDGDGSNQKDPHVGVDWVCSTDPGHWRPDPISGSTLVLGAHWADVKPFVMTSAAQFRCTTPPALTSQDYADAIAEVKSVGGDGVTTSTKRTLNQDIEGIFWAYDGGPTLCAPPRLFNQVTQLIATQKGTGMVETARLFALVNVAMADAGIASWESKFHHDFWRPITAIREAGDSTADPTWTPLGAPSSDSKKVNFTPPFPSYPSGHATFGGALFQVLRNFYKTDDIAFDFVSDEFDGKTTDNQGNVRPRVERHFSNLSQAEEENGQSRIYLGIHYVFDKTEGIKMGRKIGDLVFKELFAPVK